MVDVEKLKEDLKSKLSDKRYEHSIGVAEVAYSLALCYGVDKDRAYLAGLLHDIAKEFSEEENLYYINKYNKQYLLEKRDKKVLHADVGALYLKDKYNIDDEICNAVRVHTTGDSNMSIFDKIIFVSDKIERNRSYSNVNEIRRKAYLDIDDALVLCLSNITKKLESKKKGGKVL